MGSSLLAGCSGDTGGGGGGGDSEGDWTLKVQHWWTSGAARKAMDFLINGYKERNPKATVNDNPVAGSAGTNLQAVIREKVLSGDPPSTWQDWPGLNLKPYTEANALKDITAIWEDETDMAANFREGPKLAARAGNPDNPFVCVPTNIHRINNIFYDIQTIEQAGVDPDGISDPNELVEVVKKAQADTGMAGISWQTGSAWSTLQVFSVNFLGLHGADAYRKFRTGEDLDTEISEALQVTKDLMQYNIKDASSVSNDEAAAKITNGNAVFVQEGDWQGANYQVTEGYKYGEDWGHAPWPGTDGDYLINTDGFPYPTPNPSPPATDAWMKWVGSAEAQAGFNPIKGGVPCRTDVDVSDFPPFLQDQFDDFKNAQSNPLTITHGDGVTPNQGVALKDAMSRFISSKDVSATTSAVLTALS
ncbi:MAG: ABC transporter substrate-binding protein [Halobacteriaceae archaeon]